MHWTLGILRHFQAFSTPEQNPALEVLSTPAPAPVTQTVETVEKVPFQKMIYEKWDGNIKKRLVFMFRRTFWRFLSLLWEIFVKIFLAKSFSTVSLAGYVQNIVAKCKVRWLTFSA